MYGKPFLMLAGELHNSSASSLEYMEPMWNKLEALGLNTVLATVSWELIEPQEGRFDFTLVDGLIEQARRHNLHLVFLWFASWKNAGMKTSGTWSEIFGDGPEADEIFMAWYFAKYIGYVAKAGKSCPPVL
jgi:hypothetical protein